MKKVRYRDFEKLKLQNGRGQKRKCCFATQAGITLVALVVTIVVLLILAGVTITYVFSDNGILSQAQSAADKTDAAIVLEEIQSRLLAIQLANTDTWTYSNADVIEVIEEVTGVTVAEGDTEFYTENGNKVTISSLWVDGTSSGTWHYDDDGNVTNGTTTLTIGDYVDYDAGDYTYTSNSSANGYGTQVFNTSSYAYGWRVLGVDETTGQILLISEDLIGPDSGGYTDNTYNRTYFYMQGQTGYLNFETELETICSYYGKGTGAAGARSVTVEDINKITGYDPETAAYGSGTVYEYGNEVTYTNKSGYIYYLGKKYPIESTSSTYTAFTYYTGTKWDSLDNDGESVTLTSTYYKYYPNTLTDSSSGTEEGISTLSTEYYMLFTNSSTGAYSSEGTIDGFYYWLNSGYVTAHTGYVDFGCLIVDSGYVRGYGLFSSFGETSSRYRGLRAVVYLKSDISLTYDSIEGEWVIS